MKKLNKFITIFTLCGLLLSCGNVKETKADYNIVRFANSVDISATPQGEQRNIGGYFLDMGSWVGYTIPKIDNPTNGFCGPFDINSQKWISREIVGLYSINSNDIIIDSTSYFPGSINMQGKVGGIEFTQDMYFADQNNSILKIKVSQPNGWILKGNVSLGNAPAITKDQRFIAQTVNKEMMQVTFPANVKPELLSDGSYMASPKSNNRTIYIIISHWNSVDEMREEDYQKRYNDIVADPEKYISQTNQRWTGYIKKTVRDDMPEEYNRMAVKAVMTLISNWRGAKGDLHHEGIIPSHAVTYFNGFWAWDSWKHSVAIVDYEPELAKNQVRTMFDYQLEDGMVIDCIFADKSINNSRDSKSSIAAWAVKEIFDKTQDTLFVKEMMPKLVKYYKWWYNKRDINNNNLCEFGSTDGTLVAAKWESGMDNAVRFDNTKMKKIVDDAYVMNQESVDLNSFLAFERENLIYLAGVIGENLQLEDYSECIRNYFFNSDKGFFYDRLLTGEFVEGEACEGWTPLWTKLATKQQAEAVREMISKPNKFSTYIPFPTCAADVNGFDEEGYWRGAVWLDQAYFGIKGLRNYGYNEDADKYTKQIFERCEGLLGDGPITENYNPHKGTRAQARHFSWSAAHILMMFKELGVN